MLLTDFFVPVSSFASEIETTSYGMFNDTDTQTPSDSDNDGIADISDNRPLQPETMNGFEDADGCSDTLPPVDSDNDGIIDSMDNCPTQSEALNGFEDIDGCPDVPTVKDTDGDGILNRDDLCPRESETINNYQDLDGCPDTVATADYDGIINMGKCQFEAEIINGYKDTDGCPIYCKQIPTSDKCSAGQTNIGGKCVVDSPNDSTSDVVQWTAVIAAAITAVGGITAAKFRKHS